MNWLLPSSANTLEYLEFCCGLPRFTRTPIELGSFKNLSSIYFTYNQLNMTISTGSIFSNPGMSVGLRDNNIVSVEMGSFLGK